MRVNREVEILPILYIAVTFTFVGSGVNTIVVLAQHHNLYILSLASNLTGTTLTLTMSMYWIENVYVFVLIPQPNTTLQTQP